MPRWIRPRGFLPSEFGDTPELPDGARPLPGEPAPKAEPEAPAVSAGSSDRPDPTRAPVAGQADTTPIVDLEVDVDVEATPKGSDITLLASEDLTVSVSLASTEGDPKDRTVTLTGGDPRTTSVTHTGDLTVSVTDAETNRPLWPLPEGN